MKCQNLPIHNILCGTMCFSDCISILFGNQQSNTCFKTLETHIFRVKRSIIVVSFGTDGDTRLLTAMKISSQLKVSSTDKSLYNLSPLLLTAELKEWTWFWLEKTTSLLYIQDYIHFTVKLKSRLLKPSP